MNMQGTPSRRSARFEERREAILTAAARLFNEKGLRGATFSDVASAVGLITTSVTYYYPRKDDLAAACMLRTIAAYDAIIAEAGGGTPAERLARFMDGYFVLLAGIAEGREPELMTFYDIRSVTGEAMDRAFAAFNAMFRNLRALLRLDPTRPALPQPHENIRAHLVLSQILWTRTWAAGYESGDYPRLAARMTDILIHGLRGDTAPRGWNPTPLALPDPAAETGGVSRAAYLRAATETINARGYQGASVDSIAARLNVTRGSFYHHHDHRDDLLASCFDRSFGVIHDAQQAARGLDGGPWARLAAITDGLVRRQAEGSPLLRHMAVAAAHADLRPDLTQRMRRQTAHYAGLIADGMAQGCIRPIDPMIAAQMIAETIDAAADLPRWAGGPISAEDASRLYVRALFDGVLRDLAV